MAAIHTRDFYRIVEPGNLPSAIFDVGVEVNTFLASLPNLGDALDIRYTTGLAAKYGERIIHLATVIYVETP